MTKKIEAEAITLRPLSIALCSMLFAFFLLLFAAAPLPAAQSENREGSGYWKIALFPIENYSEDKDALANIVPVLKDQLEKKGIEIVDDDRLNKFLLKERVRATGYISSELARKAGKELDVKAVLLGSINAYYTAPSPVLGISARLIDTSDDTILWAGHASATGEDFTSILELGRIESMEKLIPKIVGRLLSSFSTAPPQRDTESAYKVAVMPFQNRSKVRDAGMIATYMFLVELFKNQRFIPLEYGDIRSSIIDLRVRQKGELDYGSIEGMSGLLNADAILVGTVEYYSDRLEVNAPPEVVMTVRLLDAKSKRILWYDSYQMNGDEDITIFDWGKLRSVDAVAYKVVSKLTKRMERAVWY